MRSLVYLSPVPWASFAQRPHKFAEWFHGSTGGNVLWLDPYPTRLPQAQDFRRLLKPAREPAQATPPWMQVLRVGALPIEPLPGSGWINGGFWRSVVSQVAQFAADSTPCDLVVGKPSTLALRMLQERCFARTAYDAMDDFPSFHGGLSSRSVARTERAVAESAEVTLVSSSRLAEKFHGIARRVVLARNACDPDTLPPPAVLGSLREPDLVGYVGTLASWFDWGLVVGLARAHPGLRFRLTGPLHVQPPSDLPANIELRPACSHELAIREMARFSVGLIPFRRNALTDSVDPVKYYEYRALGVPVVSTAFGEMPMHAARDSGVHLVSGDDVGADALSAALDSRDSAEFIESFRQSNSWEARFTRASEYSSARMQA